MSDESMVIFQDELDVLIAQNRKIKVLEQRLEEAKVKRNAEVVNLYRKLDQASDDLEKMNLAREQEATKMMETEREMIIEISGLKQRLAQASEENERLCHHQKRLHESQMDKDDQCKAVTELVSTQNVTIYGLKHEVQSAESKIQQMTESNEELHKVCNDVRNEHTLMMASVKRSLVAANGELDDCKETLAAMKDELSGVKTELARVTLELEMTAVSKREVVKRWIQNLDENQREYHVFEKNSSEVISLRSQLQQAVELKKISEEQCKNLQKAIKEMRESFIKYESASHNAVLMTSPPNPVNICSLQALTRPEESLVPLTPELKRSLCRNSPQKSKLEKANGQNPEVWGKLQGMHNELTSFLNACTYQQMSLVRRVEEAASKVKMCGIQGQGHQEEA